MNPRQGLSVSTPRASRAMLCLLALLFLAPCYAQPEDTKPWPLPSGPRACVRQDVVRDRLAWCHALTVDAYRQFGLKSPAWDDGALKLLEVYCKLRVGTANSDDILAVGEPLLKAGCNDPLVLYVIAEATWERSRPSEAEPLAARAVEGFKTVPYSKAIAWDAPVTLLESARAMADNDPFVTAKDLSVKWLVQATTEPGQQSGNHRPLWNWLAWRLREYQYRMVEEVYRGLQAEPHADLWFVNMVGGTYFVREAWKARGAGFANTVTDQAEKTFQEDLKKAQDCFTKAWELHREYPEAATAMIEVAMASDESKDGDLRRWFDRAVTAQFDWPEAYSSYEWALRPRWSGSVEQMAAFGEECLATQRFDTIVPRQYLDVALAIADEEHTAGFWQEPAVYPNLKWLFEGYAASPSQTAEEAANWKSQHAAFAWRTERYDEAARLMAELGPKLSEVFFSRFFVPMPVIRGQVLAATGPQATAVKRAEALYASRAAPEALAAFTALGDQLKDPALQPYLNDRLAALRLETAFAKGDWVPLQPATSLAGWRNVWGQWQVDADGTMHTMETKDSLVVCAMRTGNDFELTGTVELPGDGRQAAAGVAVGADLSGVPFWSTLMIAPQDGQFQWCDNFNRHQVALFMPAKTYQVTLRVWQGQATAYVNGRRCLEDLKLFTSMADAPGTLIGFGAGEYEGDAGVKYTNFRVRKLTEKPTNPEVLPAAQTAAQTAPHGKSYLFYEAEKTLQAKGWNTADFYAPSGGFFFYRMAGGSNATAHFDQPGRGPWAVWLRVRDETDGQRQVIAKVNGKPSCTMGGTNAADWRWFQLSVVDSDKIDLEVIPTNVSPMDAWIDSILITDDLGFIPSPKPPLSGSYTTYQPATDPTKDERAAWIWWPANCAKGSVGFYRKSFDLATLPARATLDLAASGAATVWINMNKAAVGTHVDAQDIKALLVPGKNEVAVQMPNGSAMPGLKLRLWMDLPGGAKTIVRTDPTWKSSDNIPPMWGAVDFDDSAWLPVFTRITDQD